MERVYFKIVQVAAAVVMAVTTAPFFKLPEVRTDTIHTVTNAPVYYDTLSGFTFTYETVEPLFSSGVSQTGFEVFASVLLLVLYIILLLQFLSAITEKPKYMLYTAIPLFSAVLIFYLFIFKNDDPGIVMWGYYAFMLLEAIIIVLAPMARPKPKAKNTINIKFE